MKFSAWSIDRIKSGKKIQTRRPVKFKGSIKYTEYDYNEYMGCWQFHNYERGMSTARVDFPWQNELNIIGRPNYTLYGKILITKFSVEHLQDINSYYAEEEGCNEFNDECTWCHGSGIVSSSIDIRQSECPCRHEDGAIDNFKRLWSSIHGEGNWETNPLVWVIDFMPV